MKTLLCVFLLIAISVHAEDVFPAGDLNKITFKTIPACPAIEAETFDSEEERAWEKGFRLCARYIVEAESTMRMPIIVLYPDWTQENASATRPQRQLIQLLLNPKSHLPHPKKEGLKLVESPSVTIACYATRGTYTHETFKKGLEKILAHLKSAGIPTVGVPRHALYQPTNWLPEKWRISEVQVPIPNLPSSR